MSSNWRTNHRTGRPFVTRQSGDQKAENHRLLVDLNSAVQENKRDENAILAAMNILLVRDGLKPAGYVTLKVDRKKLISLLDQLGLKYKVNLKENTVYFAKTDDAVLRLIRANDLGIGDIGAALGYPRSAVRWFNARNAGPAIDEFQKNFPYMPRTQNLLMIKKVMNTMFFVLKRLNRRRAKLRFSILKPKERRSLSMRKATRKLRRYTTDGRNTCERITELRYERCLHGQLWDDML